MVGLVVNRMVGPVASPMEAPKQTIRDDMEVHEEISTS